MRGREKYVSLKFYEPVLFVVLGMVNFSTKSRLQQSKKIQNYFKFRSAEYQGISNHSTKPYLSPKKQNNLNQFYMKNRSNINHENNTQDYHRYRSSTYHPPPVQV